MKQSSIARTVCARTGASAAILVGLLLTTAHTASANQPTKESTVEVREGTIAEALAPGETRALEAIVLNVKGRARWRPSPDDAWKPVTVDDRLAAGAEIRTAMRSKVTLRAGLNGSIQIDSVSVVHIPELLQNGDTLRTRLAVQRGRADIKVDKVGLTNDFEVITPSSTLAVRGTGIGIHVGALFGTQFHIVDLNEISLAEVMYIRDQRRVSVSNGGRTSDTRHDPVMTALVATVQSADTTTTDDQQAIAGSAVRLAYAEQRRQGYEADTQARTAGIVGVVLNKKGITQPPPPGSGSGQPGDGGGSGSGGTGNRPPFVGGGS